MTTTENTLIDPVHSDLDAVEVPEMPRARRRRRTAIAVLAAAIALVAALLAGALATGDSSSREAAADERESFGDDPTDERGIQTSSTVLERGDDSTDADDASDDAGDETDGGIVGTSDSDGPADQGGDDAPQPGVDPAKLEVSTSSLSFGQHTTKKSVTIENAGGEAMAWNADESKAWMSVDPIQGVLQPGASLAVEVTVNRAGMPSGTSFQGDLTFDTTAGSKVVHVTGSTPFEMVQPELPTIESVQHVPVMCSVNSPNGMKFAPIVAQVDGPDIEYVKVYWAQNGQFGAFDMTHNGGETWSLPAFGGRPQGTVKIAVVAKNQYGTDTYETEISFQYCP